MVTCDENIRHRTDLPAVDGRIPGNYKSLLVSGGKSYSAVRNIPKKLERGAAAFLARFGSGRGSRSGLGLQGLGWVYVRALIPPSEVLPSSRTCPTPGKSIHPKSSSRGLGLRYSLEGAPNTFCGMLLTMVEELCAENMVRTRAPAKT